MVKQMINKKNKSIITMAFMLIQISIAVFIMLFAETEKNLNLDFIHNLLFYLIIFIVPTILFISKVLHKNPITYLNLKPKNIRPILIGLGICIFITLIFSITNKFQVKFYKVNLLMLIGTVLAGLFEEIPFRGLYQTILKKRYGFVKANIITSLLFMSLHVKLIIHGCIIELIMLFFIGLWLGYIYEKTECIWTPIMVHSTYNFLIYIFRL
jgi:membrane protease YdiL (CAAX protease family)